MSPVAAVQMFGRIDFVKVIVSQMYSHETSHVCT